MGELKEHQPPMTVEEQIVNLKSIGLIVNDEEYTKKILNDISYFRLIKAYSLNLKSKNGGYDELPKRKNFNFIYSTCFYKFLPRQLRRCLSKSKRTREKINHRGIKIHAGNLFRILRCKINSLHLCHGIRTVTSRCFYICYMIPFFLKVQVLFSEMHGNILSSTPIYRLQFPL